MKKSKARSRTKPPVARSPKPPQVVTPAARAVVGRRTARPAAGRTRPLTAEVPARTIARERVVATFADLGVTPTKAMIRRATDRLERALKAKPDVDPMDGTPRLTSVPDSSASPAPQEPASTNAIPVMSLPEKPAATIADRLYDIELRVAQIRNMLY